MQSSRLRSGQQRRGGRGLGWALAAALLLADAPRVLLRLPVCRPALNSRAATSWRLVHACGSQPALALPSHQLHCSLTCASEDDRVVAPRSPRLLRISNALFSPCSPVLVKMTEWWRPAAPPTTFFPRSPSTTVGMLRWNWSPVPSWPFCKERRAIKATEVSMQLELGPGAQLAFLQGSGLKSTKSADWLKVLRSRGRQAERQRTQRTEGWNA